MSSGSSIHDHPRGDLEDKIFGVSKEVSRVRIPEDSQLENLPKPDACFSCSLMLHRESISMEELAEVARSWLKDGSFSRQDLDTVVQYMEKSNKLMVHDDEIHLI
jgi:hypothetical protein